MNNKKNNKIIVFLRKLLCRLLFVAHETITLNSTVTVDCLGQKALWTIYENVDTKYKGRIKQIKVFQSKILRKVPEPKED
jgi:hypothetical protein